MFDVGVVVGLYVVVDVDEVNLFVWWDIVLIEVEVVFFFGVVVVWLFLFDWDVLYYDFVGDVFYLCDFFVGDVVVVGYVEL